MTYRAKPITQRDGSTLQYSNCLMAAAAVGLDYHTLGTKTSTGKKMRQLSGDSSGGTNSDEIQRAWERGYDEHAIIRDGQPWEKVIGDLKEGRLVMLQWWAATVGEVCISGSGAYGHGVTVAPESRRVDGRTEWLVADPWCKPARWGWVRESKMKAGAEEWYRRMARGAGGGDWGPSPDPALLRLIVATAKAHMDRYHAGGKDDPSDPPGASGPSGILFASTRRQSGSNDMSINTNANKPVTAGREVKLLEGTDFFDDAQLQQKLGDLSNERWVPMLGAANGADGRAVLVNTSKPYNDGTARPTIVYVRESALKDFRDTTPTEPGDCTEQIEAAIEERDKEWRAWLDSKTADAPDR